MSMLNLCFLKEMCHRRIEHIFDIQHGQDVAETELAACGG